MIIRQITVNHLTLHYAVQGQGPPALLVHGHASGWTVWARMMTGYLQDHYRCYAFDLPGHGRSVKPPLDWYTLENFTETLYRFCLELGLADMLLIGHSLGGLLSLALSLEYPDLVSKLILIAPAVSGGFLAYLDWLEPALARLVRRPIAERLLGIYQGCWLLAVPGALNTYAHPSMLLSESFRRSRAAMARCTAQSLVGSYQMIRRADLSQRLAQLRPPTLVITGAKDRVVPPDQASLVARRAPRAELVIIPGAGHLPMDEQSDSFDVAVKKYLQIPRVVKEEGRS